MAADSNSEVHTDWRRQVYGKLAAIDELVIVFGRKNLVKILQKLSGTFTVRDSVVCIVCMGWTLFGDYETIWLLVQVHGISPTE